MNGSPDQRYWWLASGRMLNPLTFSSRGNVEGSVAADMKPCQYIMLAMGFVGDICITSQPSLTYLIIQVRNKSLLKGTTYARPIAGNLITVDTRGRCAGRKA